MNDFRDYREDGSSIAIEDMSPAQWRDYQERIISVIYPLIAFKSKGVADEYLERIKQRRRKALDYHLEVGTIVMLKEPQYAKTGQAPSKFEPKWLPYKYRVVDVTDNGAYTLLNIDTNQMLGRKVTADQLHRISGSQILGRYREQFNDDTYEVETILDDRVHKGTLQYLVKWRGWPIEDAEWVDSKDVQAPLRLKAYRLQKQMKAATSDQSRAASLTRFFKKWQEEQQQQEENDDPQVATRVKRTTDDASSSTSSSASSSSSSSSPARRTRNPSLREVKHRRSRMLDAVPVQERHESEADRQARQERLRRREQRATNDTGLYNNSSEDDDVEHAPPVVSALDYEPTRRPSQTYEQIMAQIQARVPHYGFDNNTNVMQTRRQTTMIIIKATTKSISGRHDTYSRRGLLPLFFCKDSLE